MDLKVRIARAQLGTALSLFICDKDALSVHALACGGSEVIEGVAEQIGLPTLSTHIMNTSPDIDIRKIRGLRYKYWNAIKHFYCRDNATARDDENLMGKFSDAENDIVLFNGWLDYLVLAKRLPVEAQVFQVWWYATNEDKMNPNSDPTPYRTLFPDIAECGRSEQKRRLRRSVVKYRSNRAILDDPRTELAPLVPSAV